MRFFPEMVKTLLECIGDMPRQNKERKELGSPKKGKDFANIIPVLPYGMQKSIHTHDQGND
jgi:hypothetical protein